MAQTQPQFFVNTGVDAHDANPGDGICATSSGDCSLRAAIEENESDPDWGIITLPALPSGNSYILTEGPLTISTSTSIQGEDASTTRIDANGERGFLISGSAGFNAFFSNLAIHNGFHTTSINSGQAGAMFIQDNANVSLFRVHLINNEADWRAGAIFIGSSNHVTMQECYVAGSRVPRSDASGVEGSAGAILNGGTLIIHRSTFSGNMGTRGGAIQNVGSLEIFNSTFSGNLATYRGGAIHNAGLETSVLIAFSTFTENEVGVTPDPGRFPPPLNLSGGGAIHNSGLVSMGNSIMASNVDHKSTFSDDYSPDAWSKVYEGTVFNEETGEFETATISPTFTSYRGNILGTVDPEVWNIADGTWGDLRFDQEGIDDPQLGGLYYNGGKTPTHAPLAGSPALENGTGSTSATVFDCPETDQRGLPRPPHGGGPNGERCDVGAYEAVPTSGVLEAEDAEFSGIFEIGTDGEASGGEFVHVPNGTGNLISGPHEIHSVRFEVYVDVPGNYNIMYRARGASASDNSFWVKVNESDYYLTDFSPTSQFEEYLVTDRGASSEENPEIDPVTVYLSRGVHKVNFYLREDGAQLDHIQVVPASSDFSSPQNLEVESSALLFGAFMVTNDPAASNSQYVIHPANQPDITDGPDDAHKIVQNITVDEAGTYLIRSHVWAEFDSKNSFYVKVDGLPEEGYLWDMTENNFSFGLDYVSDRGNGSTGNPEQDPVEIYLSEGEHIIEVFAREAGTGIDNIGLELKQDTGGDFVCEGDCLNAEPIVKDEIKVLNTTGDKWYVVEDNVNGWQASEMAGRTIFVNGVQVQPGQVPLPAKVNGKYYFHFTEGQHPWASWSFWNW